MGKLKELLNKEGITLKEITEYLDSLTNEEEIAEIITLGKKEQMKLWDLAEEAPEALTLEYFVPADAEPLKPFVFEGKNSLPAFTRFQKVFYKQHDGTIGGYNNQKLAPITGWGYMILEKPDPNSKEVLVNYLKIPSEKPEGWPEIKPNCSGLSRFVYCNMIDHLRWVNRDVVIGRAYKKGKPMPNWFVLCRRG